LFLNGACALSQGGGWKTQMTQHVHQAILAHFYGPDGVFPWAFFVGALYK
jgi:hypothetical protein